VPARAAKTPSLSRYAALAGARKAPFPDFIEPAHPTQHAAPPEGGDWVHEIKVDGYRAQLHLENGRVRMYSRRGNDWSDRFAAIAEAAKDLPLKSAVIDGEVIVATANGLSDFAALQTELANLRSDKLTFYAFDLLYADGFDLKRTKLIDRKSALKELLASAPPGRFLYSDHLETDGSQVYARACELGIEGVVSKLRDSPYQSGRTELWRKSLCRKRDTFPIVAFVAAQPKSIAALYLGRRDGGDLLYAGKAGTGFTFETARSLRERLDPLVVRKSPLTKPVKKPKATWVRPELLADVQFTSITPEGKLRHASFKGLRDDLAELPEPAPKPARWYQNHVQRLLADAVVPSKEELRKYWRTMGATALPYLKNRPLTLVRHAHDKTFFHTGRLPAFPAGVRAVTFEKREGGEGIRPYIDSVAGLVALIELDAVELHPWNATVDDLEHPDVMVFDLDPGEDVPWDAVTEAALALRDFLTSEGFEPRPKSTGGKGLHLMLPLDGRATHDEIRVLSRRLAERFARTNPDRYTALSKREGRAEKIFIDHLRNGRGQTAIGVYSPRARANFPLAVPLSWAEVERGVPSDAYTMRRLLPKTPPKEWLRTAGKARAGEGPARLRV
jgi:bifunctional non-homologous end joining protein LigD